LRKPSLTHDT
jgi:hypothetical protein